MPIDFLTIPVDLRSPGQYIEFDNSRANRGLTPPRYKVVVFGQKLAAAPAIAGVPIQVLTEAHAINLFGRGSMLARMFKFIKAADPVSETWAVPFAEAGGSAASTGTLTVASGPTASGSFPTMIAGQVVNTAVTPSQSAASVATALAAAVNANLDLPVTAAAVAAVVTLTARHKGVTGNFIDLRQTYYPSDTLPAGLAITIAAMSGGSVNPDVTPAFAALGDMPFGALISPFPDSANLAVVESSLAARWGYNRQVDGFAYTAAVNTYSALATLGAGRNSQFSSIGGMRGLPNPPWELAAAYGAVVGLSGSIDPARPQQGLVLPGILAPAVADRMSHDENELLLHEGISTFEVDGGDNVTVALPITTYQTDGFGLLDTSYLTVNKPLQLSNLRYTLRAWIAQRFPRFKLCDDGNPIPPGQAMTNPSGIAASLLNWAKLQQQAGQIENLAQFKTDLVVERDPNSSDRIDVRLSPDLVDGFRLFAGQMQFIG